MAYELSDRFSSAGHGTNILPAAYAERLFNTLPSYAVFWEQFLARGEEWKVFGAGKGRYWKMAYIEDKDPNATALASGTGIVTSDQTNTGVITGTVEEYGDGEYLENFADWMSNFNEQQASAAQWARHAWMSRNKIIGDTFAGVGDAVSFSVQSTGATLQGSAYTGSTTYIKPQNIRAMRSWLFRHGQSPFDNGKYAFVYSPGAIDALMAQSEVYSSAAELGLPDFFLTGKVRVYQDFMFFEEQGKNRSTKHNTTGTCGTNGGMSLIICKNAVVGGDEFSNPGLIKYYPDTGDDFGRRAKIGWYAIGGYGRTIDSGTESRIFKVFSQHSG